MSTAPKRKDLGKMFETVPADKPAPEKRQDRVGKQGKLFQLNAAANKQLAYLAIDQDRTQQSFITEGLNMVFEKYGKLPIA